MPASRVVLEFQYAANESVTRAPNASGETADFLWILPNIPFD